MNTQTQLSDFAIPEKIMAKIWKRQKTISSIYDLSPFGYSIHGINLWISKEYQKNQKKKHYSKNKKRKNAHDREAYHQKMKDVASMDENDQTAYFESRRNRDNQNRVVNHEQILIREQRWREKNREKIAGHKKKYNDSHRAKIREDGRKYNKTLKGKNVAQRTRNRRRKMGFLPIAVFKPSILLSPTHYHHIDQNHVIEIPAWLHFKYYANRYTSRHRKNVCLYIQSFLTSEYYDILISEEFEKLKLPTLNA